MHGKVTMPSPVKACNVQETFSPSSILQTHKLFTQSSMSTTHIARTMCGASDTWLCPGHDVSTSSALTSMIQLRHALRWSILTSAGLASSSHDAKKASMSTWIHVRLKSRPASRLDNYTVAKTIRTNCSVQVLHTQKSYNAVDYVFSANIG